MGVPPCVDGHRRARARLRLERQGSGDRARGDPHAAAVEQSRALRSGDARRPDQRLGRRPGRPRQAARRDPPGRCRALDLQDRPQERRALPELGEPARLPDEGVQPAHVGQPDPSHTSRQFTNDELSRHGFGQHELRRGAAFILGIEHFVRIRHESVEQQLRQIRRDRGLPRGSSGATFPVSPEPLPR